ncbi:DUF1134 domain-containing protein [Erythrobacter sp. EC-HK427]|uniref:DUF1134 domain-containing protein n=1 Tax=Erythrobacter sp. EC-HK427 TaxID=2038396 RepID=UPI0012565DFB|nr:DUF1134 domain-containing protein [Erythrobacter sp. EC-HK427]VVT06867.1 conserved exported hypothetical protein [Erythrobacter sp. EC-HK427]
MRFTLTRSTRAFAAGLLAPLLVLAAAPAAAQMQSIDPDDVIDADLMDNPGTTGGSYDSGYSTEDAAPRYAEVEPLDTATPRDPDAPTFAQAWEQGGTVDTVPAAPVETAAADPTTYSEDDLIGAAEDLFGDGAEGIARLIQSILADQGEPNAYIVGREAGGAFVLGLRYGSGTLFHRVEGNMPVYWTGPSIGFDAGANAGSTFVLVYNLYDTDDLYQRFPAGEGQAYFVGGLSASYVRRGDTVLIPIRVGAGLRLGVNAGYMRFSREQRWLPF